MRVGVTTVILGVAVLLVLVSACEEKGGSGGPAPGQVTASEMPDRDPATGENPEVDVYLPNARAMGIEGWQDTSQRLGRGDQASLDDQTPLSRDAASLEAMADTRPGLSVIPDEDGGYHLVGLVEPGDTEAVLGVFASAEVKSYAMSSVPPTAEIRSLGELAAAAIQLFAAEPSAAALVGPDADPTIAARLERAAAAWSEDARVWRVVGLPPGSQGGPSVQLSLKKATKNDPDDDASPSDHSDAQRHRRLQAMGILDFAPIEGGGIGDLVTADIEIPFQGPDQRDRVFDTKFVYDRGTDRWVLLSVSSRLSHAERSHLLRARRIDEYRSMTHRLDLLELLPECHLVVGEGGPLLCK